METRWGKLVGRYEIVAELGRGAMGVVYKARDPKIDRFVALKTISLVGSSPEETREYRERFFHEAQAAGRLVHPGIVTIFDVGEEPDTRDPYIVMEYVTGRSLDRIVSVGTGKLPLATALGLTEELAEALDYAHAQGVVHRDIKPANIMVTDQGHAKIADFGIAKLNLSNLTVPGQALGTPAYMSPEQLEGEQVDGRSDLFSLGVILYSMITGHRPFQGNSATTVCFKIANRDPLQATALNSELPPEMDAVIARAIAKDPAQRYQRGVELALDIRDLRERLQPKPSSLSKRQAESRHSDKTIATCESSQSAVGRIDASVLRTLRASAGKLIAISALILILGLLTFHRTAPSRETAVRLATRPTERAVTSTQSNNESASASSSPQPVPPTLATSTLEVQITHHFGSAAVQLWIDNNLTYSQSLHAKATSHLVLFRGTHGYDTGRMLLPAGKHRIRVRVRSKTDGYDEQKTVSGDFAQGYSRILKVTFEGRAKDMHLLLK